MATAMLSDTVVRQAVTKSGTPRLKEELARCQTVFNKDEIENMPRNKLIGYVTLIRCLNHSELPCKVVIHDFGPQDAAIYGEVEEEPVRTSVSEEPVSGGMNE